MVGAGREAGVPSPAGRAPGVLGVTLAHLGRAVTAAVCLTACGSRPEPCAVPNPPPNIVLIVADDLGWGDTGCYGGPPDRTPNIDALAAGGARFTDFHTSSPTCEAARRGLLTGRYSQRPSGLTTDPDRFETRAYQQAVAQLLPARLAEAGYATALFGKWHGLLPARPDAAGFDVFRGYQSGAIDYISHVSSQGRPDWWNGRELEAEAGYLTRLITDHAVAFIEAHAGQTPFFVMIAHAAPHQPYQRPGGEPVWRMGQTGEWERRPDEVVGALYADVVAQLDIGVGRVLEALEAANLTQDALVIFVSDNGASEFGSNGPWSGGKDDLREGGIRVPALASWPGHLAAGRTAYGFATTLDIAPTLLELAGLQAAAPAPLDGRSLVPALLCDAPLPTRPFFWEHTPYRGEPQRAARSGPWKLVGPPDALQLFQLDDDPTESRDRAAEQPQRVAELSAAWQAWSADVRGPER